MSSGGETKRPSSVSDVSVPLQIKGMDLDENQLLHFPEPFFRGNWVYHLYKCQCEVSRICILFYEAIAVVRCDRIVSFV